MKEVLVELKLSLFVSVEDASFDLEEIRKNVFDSLENERENGALTLGIDDDVSIESFDLDLVTSKVDIIKSLSYADIPKAELERTVDHVFSVIDGDHPDNKSFRVVVPEPLAENFAMELKTEFDAWSYLVQLRQEHPNGLFWNIDLEQRETGLRVIHEALGDVAVNDEDEIESEFMFFEVGTEKQQIWHWLESYFKISIGKLFYN